VQQLDEPPDGERLTRPGRSLQEHQSTISISDSRQYTLAYADLLFVQLGYRLSIFVTRVLSQFVRKNVCICESPAHTAELIPNIINSVTIIAHGPPKLDDQ
jgi:hypothetical protein